MLWITDYPQLESMLVITPTHNCGVLKLCSIGWGRRRDRCSDSLGPWWQGCGCSTREWRFALIYSLRRHSPLSREGMVAPWQWEIVDLLDYICMDQEVEMGLEIRLVINLKAHPSPDPLPKGSTISQNTTTSWGAKFQNISLWRIFLNHFRISAF